MFLPDEPLLRSTEPVIPLDESAETSAEPDELSPGERFFEDTVETRLSEALDAVADMSLPESVETALQTEARGLSRRQDRDWHPGSVAASPGEIEVAIGTLVKVALEQDDPVAALDEGSEALAEALAARDAAAQGWLQAVRGQQIDEEGAYRHARLHRATELMDLGYSVDQAVAITNANEADIRARAVAAGRNPMEPIYEYAVLNGYRSADFTPPAGGTRRHASLPAPPREGAVEALARLSDEAFADATKGHLWERLMRP